MATAYSLFQHDYGAFVITIENKELFQLSYFSAAKYWAVEVELECVREVCLLLNLSIKCIDFWRKYSFKPDLMNSNNYLNVVTLSEQHRTIICSSRFREETKSTFKCGFKYKQLVGAATSRISSNGNFNCWCQWSLK